MTTKTTPTDSELAAFARAQNSLFRRVVEGNLPLDLVMSSLTQIIEGNFDAIPQTGLNRNIDCDAQPWVPEGSTVVDHRQGGQIEFDPKKVDLYLSPRQQGEQRIVGSELMKELEGKPVLNACVLDHLLANTNLIPPSWKQDENGNTRYIHFSGTKYRDSGGSLCVRCLYWGGGQWRWNYDWLGDAFAAQDPAAVYAS